MTGTHRPLLVALSILIACAASYTALDLAGRTAAARGIARRWWLVGGALAMGIGIWSMHFTGMLAYRVHATDQPGSPALPMTYDVPRMLLSVLVAVLASALALSVVSRQRTVGLAGRVGAGLAMGAAICGMHYIGMASLHVPAALYHRAELVLASIGVAVVASFAALALAFRLRDERGGVPVMGRLAACVVMGLAITGMHYTAMMAAVFAPSPHEHVPVAAGAVLATDGLAGAVGVGTLIILALALLGAALDRWLSARLRAADEHARLYREAQAAREQAEAANTMLQEQAVELENQAAELEEQAAELEQQVEMAQSLAADLEHVNAELRARGEALEAALARERLILESLPDGTYVFDREWRFRYINPVAGASLRAGGLDPARMIGRMVLDALPHLRATPFETESRRALAEGRPVAYEERYAGDGRWYETRVVPTGDGALVLARDVTDRRRVEAERDAERALLGTVLSQLPVGVIIAEAPSGRILLQTEEVARMWGRSTRSRDVEAYADDWVGYHPDGRPYAPHEWPLARAVREGASVRDELIECERPDGSRFLTEVSAAPVHDGEGHPIAGVVVFSDVTARQRTEEAERAARAAAEGASRAKSDFLGTMSHELRTPLNAIGGYVQLLEMELRGPVTEAQRLDLSRITRAQRHLLGLVNDVLDFARIEAGTVAYATDVVPLADVVVHAHALVAPQLAEKGLRYTGQVDGVTAWADRERVEQIVLNVLANAVKFTPAGGAIDVRADADGDRVRVHVRDTGPGIAAGEQDAIFQPFVQLSSGLTRTGEGAGLGLAISRDLARAMGGDLTVHSAPGAGATFTLHLPAVADGAR